MTTQDEHATRAWYRDPTKLAVLGILAIAAYFLIAEHRTHVLPYLPYLLLLACPFLHLFMHRGHGGHGHGGGHDHSPGDPRPGRGESTASKPAGDQP
jgi:hypothetical protein